VRAGVHTAESTSHTVTEAAANWLKTVALNERERGTLAMYKQHVDLHIVPRIGGTKLAKLTTPGVNAFRDRLLAELSRQLAHKVLASLKAILKDAQRRGDVAQNVAQPVGIGDDNRHRHQLEVGVDIPTLDEIRRLLAAVDGRMRPLLVTAVFTGLRVSELRGLRWRDVDLPNAKITVRQRADRYNTIGNPKSRAGRGRIVPLGPMVVNTLKAWKLASPPAELVFPTPDGEIAHHSRLARLLKRTMITAGLTDQDGQPKYAWHGLRHFYASLCINREKDGGLELPAKVVQARLGHASIVMTLDRYGHLFPSDDDGTELAAIERKLLTPLG
jgi:integrase